MRAIYCSMCKLLTYTLVTRYYIKRVIKELNRFQAYTYSLNSPCIHFVENTRAYRKQKSLNLN